MNTILFIFGLIVIMIHRSKTDIDVLLLKNGSEIYVSDLQNTSIVVDVEPFDFVYDEELVLILKTELYSEIIQRMLFNTTEPKDVIKYVYGTKSIEYDWRGRNLYWLQSNIIEVSDISGNYRKTLYWKDMDQLNTMVLDPEYGYIFWSDGGIIPKIERASMHGNESSRNIIVKDNIKQPHGLATDIQLSALYWSDASLELIERCTYTGERRTILAQTPLQIPGGLAYFKNTLYWIEQRSQTINSFSITTNATSTLTALPQALLKRYVHGRNQKSTRQLDFKDFKLRMFDQNLLRKGHHQHDSNITSKKCDHLQLVSTDWPYYFCKCSANFHMTRHGKCVEDQEWPSIIVNSLLGISECKNGSRKVHYDETRVDNFAFLTDDDDFAFTSSSDIFTSSMKNVAAFKLPTDLTVHEYVWAMEYDWIGKTLYLAYNKKTYAIIYLVKWKSENETSEKIFLQFHRKRVLGIALDPPKRLMFLSFDNEIVKVVMDGNNDSHNLLIKSKIQINPILALDLKDEIVYWAVHNKERSYSHNDLHRCTYNGKRLKSPFKRQFTTALTFFGKYKLTSEYENGFDRRLSVVKLCDKEFDGDCKILCEFPNTYVRHIRVYPETRDYSVVNPCESNNGNCSDICLLTYSDPYFRCTCRRNHFLLPDKRTCLLQPCQRDNGNCSMICEQFTGSNYTCKCSDGFELAPDGKTCSGDMGLTFIQTISNGWRQIDISSLNYTTLKTYVGSTVDQMTYDPIKRNLYWTAQSLAPNGKYPIWRSNLDGTESAIAVSSTSNTISGLALDWLARELYWSTYTRLWKADFHASEISDISLEKLLPANTFSSSIKFMENRIRITHLEADAFSGILYLAWTERFDDPRIMTNTYGCHIVYMDTRNFRKSLAYDIPISVIDFESLSGLVKFSIDSLHQQVYYSLSDQLGEKRFYNLSLCNTDGTGNLNLGMQSTDIIDVAVFGDYIYFSDTTHLVKMHAETFEKEKIYKSGSNLRSGIGANLMTKGINYQDQQCKEIEKCWGMYNTWICLKHHQICDGIVNCYDGHDEQYCTVCNNDCKINKFSFICNEKGSLQSKIYDDGVEEFVNWTSHPISKIISIDTVLYNDCSLQFEMSQSIRGHVKNLIIYSLYHLHRFRQVIRSKMLRNLVSVTEVRLFGDVHPESLGNFINVQHLKLQRSRLKNIPAGIFNNTVRLKTLILEQNHLLSLLDEDSFSGLDSLESLSITESNLQTLSGGLFQDLRNLTSLNVSFNGIHILEADIFSNLSQLRELDLRGNDIELTSNLFVHTTLLENIFADSFTICCIKPESVSDSNCSAPKDDISNCSNLIGNRILSAFLWIFGLMAFFGNLSVLIYRGFIDKSLFKKSYFMFVYNLGISDLIMSLYMLIIAVHDSLYKVIYVWNDYKWKKSTLCIFSGILSMISSEASMMFICLITLERFICVKFAFGIVKISRKNAFYVSVGVWLISAGLAVFPKLVYPEFFSRSGVCIGIPLTRDNDVGLAYSTVIFVGLNFLLSSLIPFGQFFIFDEVKKSSKRVQSSQHGRNMTVAKRLAVVVITNCLCWIPVGILVIMSLVGVKTPREVYAWVIIFVLPVNAAVNPYLYTLSDLDRNKIRKLFGRSQIQSWTSNST